MKHIYIVITLILVLLCVSMPAYAYLYRAPLTISESSGNSYNMLPTITNADNDYLADNGYMNSTANDTMVKTLGGSEKPRMVADNKTLTAIPVSAHSQTNLYFTTGETEQETMDIITGYNGYVTVTDNSYLEPGDNFTTESSPYIDTTSVGANITYKDDAFRTWVSASGNVTGSILSDWTSPTGFVDSGAGWTSENNSFDNNTGTYSQSSLLGTGTWSQYLELSHASLWTDGIRYYVSTSSGTAPTIDIDSYYSSAWHDEYQNTATMNAWVTITFSSTRIISSVRIRMYNNDAGNDYMRIHEVDYQGMLSVTASGVSSGEHKVEVYANTVNLTIEIDDTVEDIVALGGLSVSNNANNWIFLSNGVPYIGYISISVNGTRELYLAPNDIISGTALPDRESNGGSNDGVITWGSNPAGVTATIDSIVSGSQPTVGGEISDVPRDILPMIAVSDWFGDGTVTKSSTLTNPFRSLVTMVSDNTTLTEIQVWRWMGLALLLLIVVACARGLRGHQGITAIIAGVVLGGLTAFDSNIFPLYLLVLSAGCLIGGVIAERSPNL